MPEQQAGQTFLPGRGILAERPAAVLALSEWQPAQDAPGARALPVGSAVTGIMSIGAVVGPVMGNNGGGAGNGARTLDRPTFRLPSSAAPWEGACGPLG